MTSNNIIDNKLINEAPKVKEYNYGIDILRMVSMFMICVLHTLNQGGVLGHCDQNGIINWPQYHMSWVIEIAVFGCVDLYALISGYVGINSKFKPSRMIHFLVEILFYTLLITLFFKIKYPNMVNKETWVKAIHPIMKEQYWYMSAYFGLLIVMPILNAGINNIDMKYLIPFTFLTLLCFSWMPIIFNSGVFGLGGGYTFIWLLILYIAGGLIRKFNIEKYVPPYVGVIVYVLMVALTFLLLQLDKGKYVNYNSPTILISSIGLLLTFSRIKIKNKPSQYMIKLFGEASLAVYLIHVHPLIWTKFIKNFSQTYHMTDNPSVVVLFLNTMLAGLVIYVGCSLVDIIRIYLFNLIRYKKLLNLIDRLYDKIKLPNLKKKEE